MAQGYDYNFDFFNEQWADVGPALNNYFKYLQSMNAGDTPPLSELAGMPWLDTSGDEPVPKFYDGSDWIEIDENTVIGEDVLLASGSKDSLADRLNVALNEDGTLKSDQAENMTEWVDADLGESYVSSTDFKVDGDQTDIFVENRKVKATLDASTVYAAIKLVSYDSVNDETTVTLHDSVLDSSLQKIEFGLVKPGASGSLARLIASAINCSIDGLDASDVSAALAEISSRINLSESGQNYNLIVVDGSLVLEEV